MSVLQRALLMIGINPHQFGSYFDRDVECVCSFFNKRFRFQSSHTPKFRDIVPENRQQMREGRAKRRTRKAREVQDAKYIPSEEDEKLGLELDVLAEASGLGSSLKQMTALEQYMNTLRMQQEAGQDEDEDDSDEPEEVDNGEEVRGVDGEEKEIDTRLQNGTLLPPSVIEPIGHRHGRQIRRNKEPGAVTKPSSHDNERTIKDQIALERQRKSNKEAKHHGKKAHAGKIGRAWVAGAGGKAKMSDKALVHDSLHF